jgi:hypothetical protein
MLSRMAGNKKTLVVVAFVLTLLLSTATASQLVRSGKGELCAIVGTANPDGYTKPPVVSVSSPSNGTAYQVNNVILSFNVTVGESNTSLSRYIHRVYYEADWQPNTNVIDGPLILNEYDLSGGVSPPMFYTLSLTGVPEGKHNITVYAVEKGAYLSSRDETFLLMWEFSIAGSSAVFFTVDTTPPRISILMPLNITYETTGVPLNFMVNEPASWMGYSLDEQENVTVTGNTTLPELLVGQHTLMFYANDAAGNPADAKTVTFSVVEPFLTVPVAVASGASIAAVAIGLLVYFKKRKRG